MDEMDLNAVHRAARAYHKAGLCVVRLHPGSKQAAVDWKPFQDGQTIADVDAMFAGHPDANIGIMTGRCSRIFAMDVDSNEGRAALATYVSEMVETATNLTDKGHHLLFRHPGFYVKTGTRFLPGVDVRGDGGYIVAPPSVHPSGTRYRWSEDEGPGFIAPAPAVLEGELREWSANGSVAAPTIGSARQTAIESVRAGVTEGQRNGRLTAVAGQLLGGGHSLEDTLGECLALNAEHCSPPLPERDVERLVRSIARAEAAKGEQTPGPRMRRLSDIAPEQPAWLWPGYVPLGALTLVDGDPGLGKSTFTLDLAARVTTGREMPDGSPGGRGGVVLLASEDSLAMTVRPRLDAMGADSTLVATLAMDDGGAAHALRIPEDIEALRCAVVDIGAVLVIIDPLMGHLSARTNTWNDHEVRLALTPLLALAQELQFAAVGIRHPTKKAELSAMYSGSGSVAFVASARAGFLVGRDPDDWERRILASIKSNLAPTPRSLAFRLTSGAGDVATLEWDGASSLTADDLRSATAEDVGKLAEAERFLRDALPNGVRRRTKEVSAMAKEQGIAPSTLDKARRGLNVQSKRISEDGVVGYVMWLPQPEAPATPVEPEAGPRAA